MTVIKIHPSHQIEESFISNPAKIALGKEEKKLINPTLLDFLDQHQNSVFEAQGTGYHGPQYFTFFTSDQLKVHKNRIEFVSKCTSYNPEGIFCYSLNHKRYGVYDSTHRHLSLFFRTDVTDLFIQNPALFINAQWNPNRMRHYDIYAVSELMLNHYWHNIELGTQLLPFTFSLSKSAANFDLLIGHNLAQKLIKDNVISPSNYIKETSINSSKGQPIKGDLYQLNNIEIKPHTSSSSKKTKLVSDVNLFVVQNETLRMPSLFGLSLLNKTGRWSFNEDMGSLVF